MNRTGVSQSKLVPSNLPISNPKFNASDASCASSTALNKFNAYGVRIRFFRRTDLHDVRRLFRMCIVTGEGSPARASFRHTISSPRFYIALALLVLLATTVACSNNLKSQGMLVSPLVMALLSLFMCSSYLCLLVYNSIALYVGFCLESLEEDLKDVEAWYEMRPVADSELDSDLEPTGAKAFWVAEVISPAGQAEIVGSISLDKCSSQFSPYELRRMMVSASHRRLGIAASLIKVCEEHAKASGVPSVMLRTTEYQPGAMRLYEKKHGYKEVGVAAIRGGLGVGSGWGGAKVIKVFTYLKEFGGQSQL